MSPLGGGTFLCGTLPAGPLAPLGVCLSQRRASLERRSCSAHDQRHPKCLLPRLPLNTVSGCCGTLHSLHVHLAHEIMPTVLLSGHNGYIQRADDDHPGRP